MSPNIFSSPPATKAVVTLILIENSKGMFAVWKDLREHYLPTLLGTMRRANPVVPIPVLWLTTTPVGDDVTPLHSAPPRQYNQLPELRFSYSPDNRITSRIIHRATELMLEAAAQFQGGPVSFHLFVVAASSPIQDTWGVSITMPSQIGQSEWRLLGQRIAQLRIHCHMILTASQDMSSMNELFTSSLDLQGHTRVSPWFPTNPDYTFLLSGDPSAPDLPMMESAQQQPITRPAVHRHQSFPQDVQSATSAAPVPSQNGSTPSLVSSLQKVHGLSRKKLYGTQPPRQPFVREEPVRTKYKSTPTPLSIPVGSQPFSIPEEPRVVSKTKVERGRRIDRLPHVGDVSNSSSPGRRSPWNHISSDVGSSPSSPTASLSSQHTTSPTIPLYPELVGYPASPPTSSANFPPSVVSPAPMPETSFSAHFPDPSGGYFSIPPPFQSPPSTAITVPSQGPTWTSIPTPMAKSPGTVSTARRHSQELPHGVHMQSLSAMSSKYRLDSVSTDPRPIAKNAQKVKDAGDVPFIFSPELEAATAAKLKAALQSTPTPTPSSTAALNPFPTFTSGMSLNYAATEDAYASTQLPRPFYDATQDQDPRTMLTNGHVNGLGMGVGVSDGELDRLHFGSTSSSSLQGWAG